MLAENRQPANGNQQTRSGNARQRENQAHHEQGKASDYPEKPPQHASFAFAL